MKIFLFNLSVMAFISGQTVFACSSFLFSKGSTSDGSVFITYSADSHTLYGELFHWPAKTWPEGSYVDLFDWDNGRPLGRIPQARQTYNVVSNINEHQLAIGESTFFNGRPELSEQPGALIDYAALIHLALQRVKTAREAIHLFNELVSEHGYAGLGESFSIADSKEAWIMELIGKGKYGKGAVWVALRVPDGYICGHANQARITNFPLNDPQNCLYSPDVISFARERGWFGGKDENFSFSDTYCPLAFKNLRACEARVWALFNRVNAGMGVHEDYAMGVLEQGRYGYGLNRMPLWIKPDKPLDLAALMALMRDHYEGTKLSMYDGFGSGPYHCPYRLNPIHFKVDTAAFINERAISVPQTGFVFVAQLRDWLPDPIGGILWFGLDDSYTTVFSPMYCCMTQIPEPYRVGKASLLSYDPGSAFWVFNMVANWAYTKYDQMIRDIRPVQQELEAGYRAATLNDIDLKANELYNKNKASAVKFLTAYSVKTGEETVARWQELLAYLFVKYLDGNIKRESQGQFETNAHGVCVTPAMPWKFPMQWDTSVYQGSRLVYHDFEWGNPADSSTHLDSRGHRGKQSLRLDSLFGYSPGLSISFLNLDAKAGSWIKATAWVYYTGAPGDFKCSFVATCNRGQDNYKYTSINLENENIPPDTWTRVALDYLVPVPRDKEDTLLIYLWYRGKGSMLVDDIELTRPSEFVGFFQTDAKTKPLYIEQGR